MSTTKGKVIAFPSTTQGFTEDNTIELAERLRMGIRGVGFSDAEIDFIEAWGGDDLGSTFWDTRITSACGIVQGAGSEPGEFTWPKLAAMLRQQKAARREGGDN